MDEEGPLKLNPGIYTGARPGEDTRGMTRSLYPIVARIAALATMVFVSEGFVVTRLVRDLELPLSKERLDTYRPGGGSEIDMVATYFWNLALSEALYPTIQALEVALRNGIHSAASRLYQTPYWFDRPNVLLPRELDAITDVRAELVQLNKPQNAGRIIATLRFGFWTSLLSRPYERSLWHANNLALLRGALPHLPRRHRTRGAVWRRCDEIRRLRNRIMHTEPIWNRPGLRDEHRATLEAIGWISPTLLAIMIQMDRFPDVYQNGQTQITAIVQSRLTNR